MNSDQIGTVAILEEKKIRKQMPIKETFFDKKKFYKHKFQKHNRNSNWTFFWMSQNANKMMFQLCIIVEQAINVHAPLKSCFGRNDKPKNFLDRDNFLTGKKSNQKTKLPC